MAKLKVPTVNEKLLQRYIRHAIYLEQLKKAEARLISRFLKHKTFPQIYEKLISELGRVKNLKTIGSIYKIKRLKRMLAAVQKISTAGMIKAEKMLVGRLVNISKFEAQWNINMISKTVPIDIDMTMPSNEVLRSLVTMRPMDGHKLGTWMMGYSTSVRVAMIKQIKVGVANGEALPEIGRRINKALNWKGKQAEFIARTAVSNVVHQAKEEVFKKNKDIVRKVQLVATLDDRTSLICIDIDGNVYNVGEGPRPPLHFNCRTTVVPLTPSWQEFGVVDPPAATRASMNGAVPSKITYKQWIKTQPKSIQIKVLGKTRAELYRSGKVKIDRFVGRDLKPLNLKQLAKREGINLQPAPPIIETISAKTITKVGATYAKYTEKDIIKFVDETIDVYPEKVKSALNRRGITYNIGNSLIEIDPTLKGLHPSGWSKGADWNNVGAMYNMKTKRILVAETYRPVGKKLYAANSKNQIRAALNHETGHGFDASPEGLFYSSRPEFKAAYAKDIAKLSKIDIVKNNLRFFMQEGARGRSETFADIFGDLMGGGARPGISKFFPESMKYIEEILK